MTEYRIETIHIINNKMYCDIWVFINRQLTDFKKQIEYDKLSSYGKRLEPNFIAEYVYDLSECIS